MRQVKLIILTLSFFFCALFFTPFAFADVHTSNFTPPNHIDALPTYTTPVVLASSSINTTQACDQGAKSFNAYSPKTQTTSTILIDGVTYPIFPSGFSGIGWILKASGATPYVFKPITDVSHVSNPFYSTTAGNQTLFYTYQFSWVQYGTIANGSQSITLGNIMNAYCYLNSNASGDNKGTAALNANTVNLGVTAATCNVTTQNHTVPMPDVDWLALSKIKDGYYTAGYGETKINLSCDAGLQPKFNVQAHTAGGYGQGGIGLESNSIASGFTLVIRPESPTNGYLTVEPGNTTKYNFVPGHVTDTAYNTPVQAGDIEMPFYIGIYRPNIELKPGTYTAIATFTFSYQ